MKGVSRTTVLTLSCAYLAGFLSHVFIQQWFEPSPAGIGHPVTFVPLRSPAKDPATPPLVDATDLKKIKALSGVRARVRGRIYRVGHSKKSNTYFLNFGPSRSAFTGVVFASALQRFNQHSISLKSYQGREVELIGEIRNHPQYGLEMILENPSQIQPLD